MRQQGAVPGVISWSLWTEAVACMQIHCIKRLPTVRMHVGMHARVRMLSVARMLGRHWLSSGKKQPLGGLAVRSTRGEKGQGAATLCMLHVAYTAYLQRCTAANAHVLQITHILHTVCQYPAYAARTTHTGAHAHDKCNCTVGLQLCRH